jgi:ATP-dependent Clp protease adaptor protein ClpS|tara:strand:+ start:109 stop:519 length:411 start_codon:yes stop_codon:yes gene_type:complete
MPIMADIMQGGRRRPDWNMGERYPSDMSDQDRDGDVDGDTGTGVATKTKAKTKKPSMYRVLMLNDDFTPMEFVVHVLERFFNKSQQEATQIMLHVHQKGIGVCGIFPYDIAETKVMQVVDFARKHQHPLQCTMEKV